MGLFSNFFGGAKSETKTIKTPNWNAGQQQIFDLLNAQIQKTGFGPAPTSPNAYVPRTPEEEQYFKYAQSEAVKNMATGQVPYEVGPEFANQFFEQSIRPIAQREWRETTRPGIEEAYAGSTFNSTGRLDALTKATEKYGEGLSAQKAGLVYGEELARRKAIESAYGRIAQGQEIASGAGRYSRDIETEKVMNDVQKYLMGEEVNGQYNPAYNPMISLAFNLLGLRPFTIGTKTKSEGGGLGYGMLTGLAGAAGKALGTSLGGSLSGGAEQSPNMSPQGNPYSGQTGGYNPWWG